MAVTPRTAVLEAMRLRGATKGWWWSVPELAARSQLPPEQVRRALRELAAVGRVERAVHDMGGRLAERWRLTAVGEPRR